MKGFMVQTVPIGVQKKVGRQINLIGLLYEHVISTAPTEKTMMMMMMIRSELVFQMNSLQGSVA